jgi:ADP-ribosylglycohydrolase
MVAIGTKYPNAGFGGRFKRWLHSEDHPSMGSLGNGSAMRVSPVGLIAESLEEALSLAEISACVSHDHLEGIQGAQAVAAAVYLTRTGSSKDEIKKYVSSTFGYDLNRTCDEIRPNYQFEPSCQKKHKKIS